MSLLEVLLLVSEKAGNIARSCRADSHLLSLLVQEKKEDEKNPRFLKDFKTLADVLVQEVVKHDLEYHFAGLAGHVYGEESNEFSNRDGETITVSVGRSAAETSDRLCRVLGGDTKAAAILADQVHMAVTLDQVNTAALPMDQWPDFDTNSLAVWIDPIDSTAEYIAGGSAEESEMAFCGLPCVTVLIGVFDRMSGRPVVGVVNQPFHRMRDESWEGLCVWGVDYAGLKSSSIKSIEESKKLVAVSSGESARVKARLESAGWGLVEPAGAGYKLLCVALGLVDAYVLTQPSTYWWDTCGPHALLCALGGGLVQAGGGPVQAGGMPIRYSGGTGIVTCCNKGGVIAYRDSTVRDAILCALHDLDA